MLGPQQNPIHRDWGPSNFFWSHDHTSPSMWFNRLMQLVPSNDFNIFDWFSWLTLLSLLRLSAYDLIFELHFELSYGLIVFKYLCLALHCNNVMISKFSCLRVTYWNALSYIVIAWLQCFSALLWGIHEWFISMMWHLCAWNSKNSMLRNKFIVIKAYINMHYNH